LGFPGAEAPEIADFNDLRAESLAIDRARAQKGCVSAKPSQNLETSNALRVRIRTPLKDLRSYRPQGPL
jgi:hypothetical protein